MMTGNDPVAFLSITNLLDAFRRGEVSSVEVTRNQLDRIAANDGSLNAYITVLEDSALEQAAAADAARRHGDERPLLGVPIALKDLFATAGIRTTAGANVLTDWVPDDDATVVTRLHAAGAVTLGKTNMMEFAYGYPHPDFGESCNPHDHSRTAGGSSGGSAAAVAAGMAYAGMGSDTGGSIRSPAAYCGLAGLKPTYGLVSRAGVVPLAWSLDHAGPLTRTVRDSAIVLDVISGHDPADPASAQVAATDSARRLDESVAGMRVALVEDLFERFVQPEVRSVAESAANRLADLGIEVESIRVPSVDLVGPAIMPILQAEATSYHWPTMQQGMDDYGPVIRANLQLGTTVLAKDYLDAQRVRRQLHDEVERLLATYDALVFPTQPFVAPLLDAYSIVEVPEDDVMDQEIGHTGWANLTGHPALSVPCGLTADGLPVGLQFTGRLFADATVLRLGHHYEQTIDWRRRRPGATP